MVLPAPLIQYGARALISALAVFFTVSVAAPGGLLVVRDYARMIDCSARGSVLMLSTARSVDHYKRVVKRSVNSALMYHGLPSVRRRRAMIDPPLELELINLVKSGCGYPGGLCGSIGFDFDLDFGPDATRTQGLTRTTMVPARAPVHFLLSDESTDEYLWPSASMVLASSPVPTGQAGNIKAPLVIPGIWFTEEATPTSTVPSVDWVDLVPLMASCLFLSVLVIGMLFAPRSAVDPGSDWYFVPDTPLAVAEGSSSKHGGLQAELAIPLGSSPADNVPSSTSPSSDASPSPSVPQAPVTTQCPWVSESIKVGSPSLQAADNHPWWMAR